MNFNLAEMSGSLGDLGTFIPLAVSLVSVCGMDAGSVFFFAGLFNLLSGILFNQPIPVQPMKAIAAVAIAEGLMPQEIAAAGFVTGIAVLVLGATNLVTWAEKVIPRPVVRGIQLGVGLKLAAKGIMMVMGSTWWGLDSRMVALLAAALVLATGKQRRFPSALILFVAGLLLLFFAHPEAVQGISLGWGGPTLILPNIAAWKVGILRGTLPQLPLTLLNSVIAVCALSEDLFPKRGLRARSTAISVGLMNVGACFFGSMPSCHGSGGLAAQYRFGARTGGSVVLLGLGKMMIGALFGAAAITLIGMFPVSVLGVLLIFAGLELSLPARDCIERDTFFVAVATAGGIIAVNTLVGFITGLVAAVFLLRVKKTD